MFFRLPCARATFPRCRSQLYDTQNGFAPYPGNRGVPIHNPVARYLIANPQYYPLPNKAPTDGLVQNNFIGPASSFVQNDQGDIKIEADPRPADKITAFYSEGRAFDGNIAALAITFPNKDTYPDHLGGATWVHTISPTMVNEARIGFTRIRWDSNIPSDSTGAFGLNGNSIVGIPFGQQQYDGFSYQSIGASTLTGLGVPGQAQILRDNTFTYGDNLTIQRGKHLLSLGAQLLRYQQNFALFGNGGSLGTFGFNGNFTALPGARVMGEQISCSTARPASRSAYRMGTSGSGNIGWPVLSRTTGRSPTSSRLTLGCATSTTNPMRR